MQFNVYYLTRSYYVFKHNIVTRPRYIIIVIIIR